MSLRKHASSSSSYPTCSSMADTTPNDNRDAADAFVGEEIEAGTAASVSEKPPPSAWPKAIKLFWLLLPSPISRRFGHSDAPVPQPTSTSYLNGLRGIAALVVILQHNTNEYYVELHRGWGDEEGDHYIMQLPFIRLLLHGSLMVAIFFVISGFALTYGPLGHAHAGRVDDVLAHLPSSVFRRPLRLFLPIVPVITVSLLLIQCQLFYSLRSDDFMTAQSNIFKEFAVAIDQTLLMTATSVAMPYFAQGWTLTMELHGSLLVYLCLAAFVRLQPRMRIGFIVLLAVYELEVAQWEMFLLLIGMLLADLRHLRAREPGASLDRRAHAGWWILLIFGLFVGGWPIYGNGGKTMGMKYINWIPTHHIQKNRFWHMAGGTMIVSAIENLPLLQAGLNWGPILYLGEISYALYLVHWMMEQCWFTKGFLIYLAKELKMPFFYALIIESCVSLPATFWVADIHWRLVDRRAVAFSKRVVEKLGI